MSYSCRARRLRQTVVWRLRVVRLLVGHAAIIRKRQTGSFGNEKLARKWAFGAPIGAGGDYNSQAPNLRRFGRGRRLRPRVVKGARKMTNVLLLPELRSMLAEEDHEGLTALMTELHPATVADWTEGLSVEETWKVFNHAGIDRQARGFRVLPDRKNRSTWRRGPGASGCPG